MTRTPEDVFGRPTQQLDAVTDCKLTKGGTVAEDVTCTVAGTDYPMAAAMAAGTKYLVVYCAAACKVSMGAATSATNGVYVGAGLPTVFPVAVTGTAADDKAHVQSATAGAVVTFTSMAD
jgi:methyl coenzyme M reductase subunit C